MTHPTIRDEKKYLLQNYARPGDFIPARGQGCWLYDVKGRKYLDFVAGIAVNTLGHNYPPLIRAMTGQIRRLIHVTNLYHYPHHAEVAKLLVRNTGLDRVFFCNSGTEANEAAIKFTRRYGIEKYGAGKIEVIAFTNGFHGRTYGALSATAQKVFQKNFGPMLRGFRYARYNNLDDLNRVFTRNTAAVLLEFVQGEGGIIPAEKKFVGEISRLCKKFKALLIADEIQAGLGRAGTFMSFEPYGVRPDIVTLAKPLGGGLPLGAVVMKETVARPIKPGDHGTTFGGNPVACAAARVVLGKILSRGFLSAVRGKGGYFRRKLKGLHSEKIADVRGRGLMVGVELGVPATDVITACRRHGLLILKGGKNAVRLLPPLVVTKAEIDLAVERLGLALKEVT